MEAPVAAKYWDNQPYQQHINQGLFKLQPGNNGKQHRVINGAIWYVIHSRKSSYRSADFVEIKCTDHKGMVYPGYELTRHGFELTACELEDEGIQWGRYQVFFDAFKDLEQKIRNIQIQARDQGGAGGAAAVTEVLPPGPDLTMDTDSVAQESDPEVLVGPDQKQIIPLDFKGHGVTVIMHDDGNPWWVAKEVCDILGLSDVSMSIKSLDDDEKLTQTLFVSGQNRKMWIISEPGLYSLILRSRKTERADGGFLSPDRPP